MYTLILDSATKVMYHALLKDDELIAESYIKGQNDFAVNIVDKIKEMLENEKISVDDLGKIVVGVGPGSYTGVRMAITIAKMFSSFKGIPLYEISTLALMSSGNADKTVVSEIDARRGNVFGAIYKNMEALTKEKLINKEELESNKHDLILNESEFKVNPFVVSKFAKSVENPDLITPNYLQETEAERNLKHEN